MATIKAPFMTKPRYLILILLIIALIFFTLWIKRVSLLTWGLKTYSKNQGFELSLVIERFDLFHLELSGVNINDLLLIDELKVKSDTPLIFAPTAIDLKLKVEKLDIKIFDLLAQGASERSEQSTPPLTFSEVALICKKLSAHNINIGLNELVLGDQTHSLELQIEHQKDQPHFDLKFQAQGFLPRTQENKTTGHLNLYCDLEKITMEIKALKTKMTGLRIEDKNIHIKELQLDSHQSTFRWSKDEDAKFKFDFKISGLIEFEKKDYQFKVANLSFETPALPQQLLKENLTLQLKQIEMNSEHSLTADSLKVGFSDVDLKTFSFSSDINVRNFSYANKVKKLNIKGLHSKMSLKKEGDKINALVSLTDKEKNIHLKNIKIAYQPEGWNVEFKKKENYLQLNSSLLEKIPSLKKPIKSLKGQIFMSGWIKEEKKYIKTYLNLRGENIDIDSTYGNFIGLTFKHDIKSIKNFNSSPEQEISIKKIIVGQNIDQLKLKYQVINLKKINAHSLHLENEGMIVDAQNFELNPTELLVKDLKLKITHLKLQKLLAMAVGPTVSAEGTLSGGIEIDYGQKRAKILGHLDSDSQGWIRYRATVQNQVKGLQTSDTPVSILNNYLFNFHYNKLELDISTEKNYDMKAVLGAYGQNPDYLNGKPLKLNINLEQNLLAALRSMVLSYDLPAQLKQTLEKRIGDE